MANLKRSPLGPDAFPDMPAVAGVKCAVAETAMRYSGRTDLAAITCVPGTTVAGVFTTNRIVGAPVTWTRQAILSEASAFPRTMLVNAGNANVYTGDLGDRAVKDVANAAAAQFGGSTEAIMMASTGVIGEPLDASKITDCLPSLSKDLGSASWEDTAKAIMTTDTFPKGAFATCLIDDNQVSIAGIAKGSGMIAPNMATMLGFIFTDAAISAPLLQALLEASCDRSFNAVTVDGDTSTSDMVLLAATGQAGNEPVTDIDDPRLSEFRKALDELTLDLAIQIVRDGEGASKLIRVNVSGDLATSDAKAMALSVANSPLVKTAIAGEDANWGRIMMAIGKAGVDFDPAEVSLFIGPHKICDRGQLDPGYTEEAGAAYMKEAEIDIRVVCGHGETRVDVYTCDLTHGYIDINADYRS